MSKAQVDVIQGDITRTPADAIVNAANSALAMGGGVCGAIFRAAGVAELTAACRALGGCPTGHAVITPAFGICSAKFIVHAVGPVYAEYAPEKAAELLRGAYASALKVAADKGCRSIAFPAISTGIYGYPLEEACEQAVAVCVVDGARHALTIKLVAFDGMTANALREAVARLS
jgi:O-acetyl-ADP-ribose deacetylase (regulator of RNase III)